MQEQNIYRTHRDKNNPYVTLNKGFIENPNLSWKAKGILMYLLSKPDGWQVYERDIVKRAADGKDAVNTGVKELINHGYIIRHRRRDNNGKFKGYRYEVYEVPAETGKSVNGTETGKSVNGKSVNGKSAPNNNDLIKNEKKQQQDNPAQGDPPVADQKIPVVVFSAAQEELKAETDGQAQALEMLQGINISAETGLQLLELKRPEEIIKIIETAKADRGISNPAGFVRRAIENDWTLPELQKRYDMEKEKTNALLAKLAAAELTSEAPEPGLFDKLKNICRGQLLEKQLE